MNENLEISSAKWRIFFLGLTLFNEYFYQLIAAEWWIYALVTYAIIGADIGLSPVWLTYCKLHYSGKKYDEIWIKMQ